MGPRLRVAGDTERVRAGIDVEAVDVEVEVVHLERGRPQPYPLLLVAREGVVEDELDGPHALVDDVDVVVYRAVDLLMRLDPSVESPATATQATATATAE